MRTKLFMVVALLFTMFTTGWSQDNNKLIVGKWCNPYTYESSGELKGYHFKKNGKCETINIPTLDMRTWEIKDGKLILKGFRVAEDGTKTDYVVEQPIETLDAETGTLRLVAQAKPKVVFRYVRVENLSKLYPEAAKRAKEAKAAEKENKKK